MNNTKLTFCFSFTSAALFVSKERGHGGYQSWFALVGRKSIVDWMNDSDQSLSTFSWRFFEKTMAGAFSK
jgi:hypothetical protein